MPASPADQQGDPGDQRDDEDRDRDQHEFHAAESPSTARRAPGWAHASRPGVPSSLLGPLLRHVDPVSATVWVETDRACEVEVLGRRARTFGVGGHHYALVVVEDLEPGSTTPYEVHLDGDRSGRRPRSAFPASRIRTPGDRGAFRIAFGSCRYATPGDGGGQPRTHPAGRAGRPRRRMAGPPEDELARRAGAARRPGLRRRAHRRRPAVAVPPARESASGPDAQVADFEEYTRLYHESWSEPQVRWLLSTVPRR